MSRRFSVRRSLVASALVPLALTSFVACGGKDDTVKDPAAAAPSASSSQSASPDSQPSASAGADVDPATFVDLVKAGLANTTTAHESLTMKSDLGGDLSGEGDVDYTTSPPSTAMTMTSPMSGDGDMDIRLVDGVMYLKAGGLSGGKFLKMDLSDPTNPLGSLSLQLDPAQAFASFGKAVDSVTFVGTEGSLERYRVVVDYAAMMKAMSQDIPSGTGIPNMPKKLTYDMLLDDQHRINEMDIDMGSLGQMTLKLTDFGTDVNIEAPPANQVTQMPSMPGASG